MGHRANFVVIEKNATTAYYGQWAAMGCLYFFADGPATAIGALSEMQVVTQLLSWSYAEGRYLLDRDRKIAIVFGFAIRFEEDETRGELDNDSAAMRRLDDSIAAGPRPYLECITPKWTGWRITFDDRGVDAFADYLRDRNIYTIVTQPASHPTTTGPAETVHA